MPNIKIADERVLAGFVDNLITEKDVPGLDNARRVKLRQALVGELNDAIENEMIDALSTEQLRELNEKLDAEVGDDELTAFFQATGMDFEKCATRAIAKFRADYLGRTDDEELIAAQQGKYINFQETAPEGQGSPFGAPAPILPPKMEDYRATPVRKAAGVNMTETLVKEGN